MTKQTPKPPANLKPIWTRHPKSKDLFSAIHAASLALKPKPTALVSMKAAEAISLKPAEALIPKPAEALIPNPAEALAGALADSDKEGFVRDLRDELSALLDDLDSET